MTRGKNKRSVQEIKELIAGEEDILRPLIGAVLQEVLEAEMSQSLGAEKGERIEGQLGYRSGYYVCSLITRVGRVELRVPQDRQGRFSSELFERYQRSEKALGGALAEMYIQGVSTSFSQVRCTSPSLAKAKVVVESRAPWPRIGTY